MRQIPRAKGVTESDHFEISTMKAHRQRFNTVLIFLQVACISYFEDFEMRRSILIASGEQGGDVAPDRNLVVFNVTAKGSS